MIDKIVEAAVPNSDWVSFQFYLCPTLPFGGVDIKLSINIQTSLVISLRVISCRRAISYTTLFLCAFLSENSPKKESRSMYHNAGYDPEDEG